MMTTDDYHCYDDPMRSMTAGPLLMANTFFFVGLEPRTVCWELSVDK